MPPDGSSLTALRFAFPAFDQDERSGLVLGSGGQLALVGGEQALRQSVIMLLMTMPEERLRRPSYGCNLHLLAFAPNDETTHGLAMHYVRSAIAAWEPRVEVLSVDARRDELVSERMRIELRYAVRRSGAETSLVLTLDLSDATVSP